MLLQLIDLLAQSLELCGEACQFADREGVLLANFRQAAVDARLRNAPAPIFLLLALELPTGYALPHCFPRYAQSLSSLGDGNELRPWEAVVGIARQCLEFCPPTVLSSPLV